MQNGVFVDVTPCGSCKNIPEDTILHSHRRENLKSYIIFVDFDVWQNVFANLETARFKACTMFTLYKWTSRRSWTVLKTVPFGIPNCKEALLADFCKLRKRFLTWFNIFLQSARNLSKLMKPTQDTITWKWILCILFRNAIAFTQGGMFGNTEAHTPLSLEQSSYGGRDVIFSTRYQCGEYSVAK
jgi:hypothetical protein